MYSHMFQMQKKKKTLDELPLAFFPYLLSRCTSTVTLQTRLTSLSYTLNRKLKNTMM